MVVDPTVGLVLILAYAALLLPAAWHKVRDLPVFVATLDAYRVLPRALVPALAPLVPVIEAAVVVGLFVPAYRALAADTAAALLLLYALAMAIKSGAWPCGPGLWLHRSLGAASGRCLDGLSQCAIGGIGVAALASLEWESARWQ